MAVEIKVPTVGESISEVTLVKWLKADGAWADRDEVIAELESEKATFEINAEQAGAVKHIATMLNKMKRESIPKSLIFMPMAISFVGGSLIWKLMYQYQEATVPQTGLIGQIMKSLGLPLQ